MVSAYQSIDLFSYQLPRFHIGDKKIRLIELFAGIGAQAKALERIGADFERWKVVEIDKYAIRSYNAIHGTNFEPMDIKKVHAKDLGIKERERYCYILTYSFPCQDLSVSGLNKGMAKGSGTRSGLLWEVERILDECSELPQVLLMENVPQVIGKRNIEDFKKWRSKLESLGYSNYVQILNAKDYGIPQNRNRCFMVSILGAYFYEYPQKKKLTLKLKDMLEDNVDEKYYLSEETINNFLRHNEEQEKKGNCFRFEPLERERESESNTDETGMEALRQLHHREVKAEVIDYRYDEGFRTRTDPDIMATIPTFHGGLSGLPMVKETPVLVGGVGEKNCNNNTQFHQQNRIYDADALALCQSASKSFNPWYFVGDENED